MVGFTHQRRRRLSGDHPQPTRQAVVDLAMVVAFVWAAAVLIHVLDVPGAIATWASSNESWAIDEVTLVSLCVVAALGVFSWRRWQESLTVIARHEATLDRLHSTETEVQAKDTLIRSVSHELRTPLTALLGYAEILADPDLSQGDRANAVTTIVAQGQDLSNIVDDLLTRAQAEANTLRLAQVPLSLGAQAAQVVESWRPDEAQLIETTLDRSVRAVGDPARVRQIIRNLISNGLKYGDGIVEVGTRVQGDRAIVSISNPGPPIPDEHRARIFDPYHRIDPDSTTTLGLGLGLSISLTLALRMGGAIGYDHRDGRSVFELVLPTAPATL